MHFCMIGFQIFLVAEELRNIKQEELPESRELNRNGNGNGNGAAHQNGNGAVPDIFNSQSVVSLSRTGIENLSRLENRADPWLVVLYAPWCRFSQGMGGSYKELAEKVGKFRADGKQKKFAQQELQLGSSPAILFFAKHSSNPFKCPSEKQDVDSLMAFVSTLQ